MKCKHYLQQTSIIDCDANCSNRLLGFSDKKKQQHINSNQKGKRLLICKMSNIQMFCCRQHKPKK